MQSVRFLLRRVACNKQTSAHAPRFRSLSTQLEQDQIAQIRAGIAPATGQPLAEIAAEIWGHTRNPVGPGHRSGTRILRRPLRGPLYASWYPQTVKNWKDNPCKLTDKQERWQKKLKVLRAAGKGPPKKGSGKRSK